MNRFCLFLLTFGVFGIINTEQGIVGLLPLIVERYGVSVPTTGLLVSLFALGIALSGATLPPLLSGIDRKKVMVLVLGVFLACTLASAFAPNFAVALVARVIPAFFHPVYISLALSVASRSVPTDQAPRAVSRVMMGVSAAMVLGSPAASFLGSALSLRAAMLYFALVNALALLLVILFLPSLPVSERLSYGSQLRVLKKPDVWIAILGVILVNGAVFGAFSYISEYLASVTGLSGGTISLALLAFGIAGILGNPIAGHLLSRRTGLVILALPLLMGCVLLGLFAAGRFAVPAFVILAAWGFLASAGGNINQYRITAAAREAPDFANGIFLTAANVGTTVGATVCGFFIAGAGVRYAALQGLLFLVLAFPLLAIGLRRASRQIR